MIPYNKLATLVAVLVASFTCAQKACTLTTEKHPSLNWQTCTSSGACSTVSGSVTVDANWRWTHSTSSATNCFSGNTWDSTFCPDGATCASNCCVDGADYAGTYGVTSSNDALSLKFVTQGPYSTNIGSRLYLMETDTKYKMFNLLGNEFTFDVDVSDIGCGLNGALYFVSMDADGGMSKYSGNQAGAKYGTGYCDSQCPRDVKFINGVANVGGWNPSSNDANSGVGNLGSCCAEMDIWEANSISTAYTAHPCSNNAQHSCSGDNCGGTYSSQRYAGDCDPDGCDFNSWRQGNETFYGPGPAFTLDTSKKLTVVTQFITDSTGDLSDIKRFYVQNGKVVPNSETNMIGTSGNSLNTGFCSAQKVATGDLNVFADKGGISQMGKALKNGMVLVLSLWDDHAADMLWLDSTYPVGSSAIGASRGSCSSTSGIPATLESSAPNSKVTFSGIKFGPIGSTFNSDSSSSASSSSTSVTTSSSSSFVHPTTSSSSSSSLSTTSPAIPSSSSSSTAPSTSSATCAISKWGQCGGNGHSGCKVCGAGLTCTYQNDWYWQCL